MNEHELSQNNRLPSAVLFCRDHLLPAVGAGLGILLLIYYLGNHYFSSVTPKSFEQYVLIASYIFAGVSLLLILLYRPRQPELWLLVLNLCWALFTRALLRDLYWDLEATCYWYILFSSFFTIGLLLNRKQRGILLDAITVLLGGITIIWAAVAIATVLSGRVLTEVPAFFRRGICLDIENGSRPWMYVRFSGLHRNITAAFFLISIFLLLYQCVHRRPILIRIVSVLSMVVLYFAIALQHSRSVYLSAAFFFGLAAGLFCVEKLKGKGLLIRIAASAAATLAVMSVLYAGFTPCSDLIFQNAAPAQKTLLTKDARDELLNKTAQAGGMRMTVNRGDAERRAYAAALSATVTIEDKTDTRSTVQDARTLTERTLIWAAIIPSLKEQPQIALIGQPEKIASEIVNRHAGLREYKPHMHNILFQQLMITGVPGFLIYLLFMAFLFIRLLKCYFGGETVDKSDAVLGISFASLAVYGFFEPLLNQNVAYVSLMFCLLMGCFVGNTKGLLKTDR